MDKSLSLASVLSLCKRFVRDMKDVPEYENCSTAQRAIFKRRWAQAMWDAAESKKTRTRTSSVNQLAGAKAKFVSETKLIEKLGVRGARQYMRSVDQLKPQHEWKRFNRLAGIWLYNYEEDYSDRNKAAGFTIEDQDTLEGSGDVPALPAPVDEPPQALPAKRARLALADAPPEQAAIYIYIYIYPCLCSLIQGISKPWSMSATKFVVPLKRWSGW